MQECALNPTTDWDFHYGNNNELVIVINLILRYEVQDWGCEGQWIPLNVGERTVEIIAMVIS